MKQIANLRKGFKTVVRNAITEAKVKIARIVEQQFKRAMYVFNQELKTVVAQFRKLDLMLQKKDDDIKSMLKQAAHIEKNIIGKLKKIYQS